jgi:hypothetical protein
MDILKELSQAFYDGIFFPVSSYSWGFAHDDARHKFIFKDQQFIQPLGRQNKTWKFSIPLFENIEKGLFSTTFPALIDICADGEPKELNTPDFGLYRATCVSFNPIYDPTKRDGVQLDVEFIEAPDFDEIESSATDKYTGPQTVDELAGTVDTELAFAIIPAYVPPRNGFQNPIKAITSVLDQVSLAREQFKANLDNVVYEIDRLNWSIDNTTDAQNWSLRRHNQNLKKAIYNTKKNVDKSGRQLVEETLNSPKTQIALAKDLGLTLKEFLSLNASLSGLPIIPAGTKYLRTSK